MSRVLLVAPHFWPEKIGSAPYCTELAQWFAGKGHVVTALTFRPHYPAVDEFSAWHDGSRDTERLGDIGIVRVPTQGRGDGGFISRARNDLRFLLRLCRAALDRKPAAADVILAFVPSTLSLFGARLLAMRSGARLVGVVHDIESGLGGSLGIAGGHVALSAIRLVERLALNRPDELIVLTHGMQTELQRLGCRRPIRVVPLWCAAAEPGEPPRSDEFIVAYSGNFGKKQNLDQLLPFFALLQARLPDIQVHLRGDGSERQRLQHTIEDMGLANISFHALVAADQLLPTIRAAHLHLVPQAPNIGNYAIPSKVYTIMSAGRPFVCMAEADTELAALARQSGGGICVPPNDADALFAAVRHLHANPQALKEMGERARLYVGSRLASSRIFAEYETAMGGAGDILPDREGRLATGG